MAYVVSYLGYLINHPTVANLGVVIAGTWFLRMRIVYEEALLFGYADYVAYARSTRWRLIPGIW
jgi:hypothetical protein